MVLPREPSRWRSPGYPSRPTTRSARGSVSGLPKAISAAAALSRFGTFANLGVTSWSASDGFPSTPSLSLNGATYTSDVLSFTGYETTTNQQQSDGSYPALDPLSTADRALFSTYDFPPYVDPSSKGAIPFIDLGGKYMISGAGYSPAVLKGMTYQQVSSANVISAAICRLTGNGPADVCSSPGVLAGTKKLPAAP